MSKGLIAFLIALGASTWIYNQFMKTTGSLTKRSLIAASASGLVIFLVVFIILSFIF